jgi:hypothetical protein
MTALTMSPIRIILQYTGKVAVNQTAQNFTEGNYCSQQSTQGVEVSSYTRKWGVRDVGSVKDQATNKQSKNETNKQKPALLNCKNK